MKHLFLTKQETEFLKENNSVIVEREEMEILIEKDIYSYGGYSITIINPYEEVVLYEEE